MYNVTKKQATIKIAGTIAPSTTNNAIEGVDKVEKAVLALNARKRKAQAMAQEKAALEVRHNKPHELTSALDYVRHNLHSFFPKDSPKSILDAVERVSLMYPSGHMEIFPLITPLKDGYAPLMDLVKSIEFIAEDFPTQFGSVGEDAVGDSIYRKVERCAKKRDIAGLKAAVQTFNRKVSDMKAAGEFDGGMLSQRPLSYHQAIILLDQIYARGVIDPDALRQYKGFSKEVYGETGHSIIAQLLEEVPINRNSVFLDLGSGIGNVVFQVAAQTMCKAYGAELLDRPSMYAKNQLMEFRARMRYFGRDDNSVYLRKADFLTDERVVKVLGCADLIFVNNYAFESSVNQRLMQLFLNVKENTKIVSFRPFRPLDFTITQKNMSDIASILTVKRLTYGSGSVSWTHSAGEYFIHTVDRSQLRRFVEQTDPSVQ